MLDFVVARALKKDAAVRYQDADEMAADLHACLAELRAREEEPVEGREHKTLKLGEAEPTVGAPAAATIAVDTRLPFSPLRFKRGATTPRGNPRTRVACRAGWAWYAGS